MTGAALGHNLESQIGVYGSLVRLTHTLLSADGTQLVV